MVDAGACLVEVVALVGSGELRERKHALYTDAGAAAVGHWRSQCKCPLVTSRLRARRQAMVREVASPVAIRVEVDAAFPLYAGAEQLRGNAA